ncbi:MAG: hypothetical protein ABGY96_26815 [bacterium]|nr:hypothetical protein [Gammaproteobacteria bacterium]
MTKRFIAKLYATKLVNPACTLLVIFSVVLTANASLVAKDVNLESPLGVALLSCKQPDSSTRTVSLGSVLTTGVEGIDDIVIVAAHGLHTLSEHCSMSFSNEQLKIKNIQRGQDENAYGDWAVVTLDGRFEGEIQRLPWATTKADDFSFLVEDGGTVSMIKRRLSRTVSSCQLHIPTRGLSNPSDRGVVVVSDCSSLPGDSGAPVFATVDGVVTMIGLNLGYRFDISPSPHEWKPRASIVRLIDKAVESAIVAAIKQEVITDRF